MHTTASKRKVRVAAVLRLFIAAGVVFFALYIFAYHFWWVSVLLGALLYAASYLLSKSKQGTQTNRNRVSVAEGSVVDDKDMVPETWDERKISVVLGPQQDTNLAVFYVKQIIDRFVYGQTAGTMKTRLEFLEQQNSAVKLYIERKRLEGQFNRVGWEEQAATKKAKDAAGRTEAEDRLEQARLDAEHEELLLRKEQAAKKREELKKAAAANPQVDEEERRKKDRKRIELWIERLKEQIRTTQEDSGLTEEIRMLKLNALYNELAKAEAEHAQTV
jgi:hypothetical protein